MTITENCMKYKIPEHIMTLITYDFLKEFRNQLFRIHEHYSLDTFADFGIPSNTSTGGWYAAFGKACLLTHKEELFDYWRSLAWYDSDIFDGELADMLVQNKLILEDSDKVLAKLLNINQDDVVYCCNCGKLYVKDMVIEIDETDEDFLLGGYRCFYCHDLKETADGNKNSTEYYRGVLKELDQYKQEHPFKK